MNTVSFHHQFPFLKQWALTPIRFLILSVSLLVTSGAMAETLGYVAFSMKQAQKRLEDASRNGQDFKKADRLLYFLGGITKPAFVVLDANTEDWILVGQKDSTGQPLTLDDWVTALRAAFFHRTSEPGASLDPVPCEQCIQLGQAASCHHLHELKVRFMGGIDGSQFGKDCLDADWLLKRIGGGFDRSPVPTVRSYYDLTVDEMQKTGNKDIAIAVRFWFCPIVNRVNVLKDLVLIEKFQMGVFTEVMAAEVAGKRFENPQEYQDAAAENFTRVFSENYDALAAKIEVLEKLRELTRLSALAKGVSQLERPPAGSFFFTSYALPKVAIPPRKPALTNQTTRSASFVGGVELMSLTLRLKTGDATALRDIVLRGRSPNALTWNFSINVEDGRPAGLNIPVASDSSEMAALMSQGWFLYQKQRFEAAVECFDRVLRANPEGTEDVLWAKAVALRDQGIAGVFRSSDSEALNQRRVTDAINLFRKIIELNPNYAPAHFQLGVTLNGFGNHDAAIAALERAISLNPIHAEAHYYLARAFKSQGDLVKSAKELREAIALNKDDSLPRDSQGELKSLEAKITQGSGTGRKLKSHRDERRGFEFKYPEDWQVLSAAEMAAKSKGIMAGAGSDIVLTVANPDDWDQSFILKIPNGRMDGELTNIQIEQFAEQLDRGMARTYENFKKLSHRAIKVSNATALEYNVQSTRLGEVFQTKEVILTKAGRAYIIVCTGKQAVFEKLDKEHFQPILQSFLAK